MIVRNPRVGRTAGLVVLLLCSAVQAQLVPEIGYMTPAGGRVGETIEVVLGGYDWTPDMQLFVHDPRITLELTGPPSPVLIAEPPYWFGYKARGYAWPLPREFRARLTIPADVAPGLIRWQVANANGASPAGTFHVSGLPEVPELPPTEPPPPASTLPAVARDPQLLPELPVIVTGQIRRIEEIDRYQFRVAKSGPVALELFARRLGSPLHALLRVTDPTGRTMIDVVDTEGRDLSVCLFAEANVLYEVELHDHDYAGDRSYIYKLALRPSPLVQAAYPAAGQRGETRAIEFVGLGLQTGTNVLESVVRQVTFPAEIPAPNSPGRPVFTHALDTNWGQAAPFPLSVSERDEQAEPPRPPGQPVPLTVPAAVTGFLDDRYGSDTYTLPLKAGETVRMTAQAQAIGSPLDLELTVRSPDSPTSLAMADDSPDSVDPELIFTAPADGSLTLAVTDRSGKSGSKAAAYRLVVEPVVDDFSLSGPDKLDIPLGGSNKLVIKAARRGAFKGPITLAITSLPEGVTAPMPLLIEEGKNEAALELTAAADAAATAQLCQITATAALGDREVRRQTGPLVIATTMKPRIKLTPEGLDDVRKVHRGSTFLAPILVERLEGFTGEITVEMTAKQQRHRQGLASDEFVVAPDVLRVEYPIFVPEWMETTKTSRMIVNGAIRLADPRGNVRTLLQRQELRIGLLPQGALLKLHAGGAAHTAAPGSTLRIPVALDRSLEFSAPVEVSLVPPRGVAATAEPLHLSPTQLTGELAITLPAEVPHRDLPLVLRARATKDGWPVISEAIVTVTISPAPAP